MPVNIVQHRTLEDGTCQVRLDNDAVHIVTRQMLLDADPVDGDATLRYVYGVPFRWNPDGQYVSLGVGVFDEEPSHEPARCPICNGTGLAL